jgi:hypothetical protein
MGKKGKEAGFFSFAIFSLHYFIPCGQLILSDKRIRFNHQPGRQ